MRLIGGHVSAAGGVAKAIVRGEDIDASIIQIFTNSPRGWKAQRVSLGGAANVGELLAKSSKVQRVVSHASYLINLASPEEELFGKSKALLKESLSYCDEIGVPELILHVGSHRGKGFDTVINQVSDSICEAFEGLSSVRLLLENSAGAGDSVGRDFFELSSLISRTGLSEVKLGICVDTQHLFAKGYDYREAEGLDALVAEIIESGLEDRIKAIHLNDSKSPVGSKLDRHENFDEGMIGSEAIARLISHQIFANVDLILEVPGDGDGPRLSDVEKAKALV
ncbi:MAG: deoxyribonuclease IV [Actinomycetota bacterium]|nr:deoxyribonuclease IV [Actinomycetota bacterium]